MATKTTKAHDELAQRDEAIRAAEERRRDAQARAAEQLAEVQALLDRDAEMFAAGQDEKAEQVRGERAKVREVSETWQARIAACAAGVEKAKTDRRRFIEQHGDDLLAELRDDAAAVVRRIEDAKTEMTESILAFAQLQQKANSYCDYRRHRRDPVELGQLVTALERVTVPDPMPTEAIVEEVA